MQRRRRVATAALPFAVALLFAVVLLAVSPAGAEHPGAEAAAFPPPLDSYPEEAGTGIGAVLRARIAAQPFNLVGSLIFLAAILHTFMAGRFAAVSHRWRHEHQEKILRGEAREGSVSLLGELFHFLGEVEVVFGIWSIVLMIAIAAFFDWSTAIHYVGNTVNFTEAAFVVVIMTLASTRPILKLAGALMDGIARVFGGSLRAMWLTTLTVGPVLGALITEPAAMTLSALVLSERVYSIGPSTRLKYATLALLFLNVSVGGTLTNFAAPPVLMVAEPWGWSLGFMFSNFGWKALVGIVLANSAYLFVFRREFASLGEAFALQQLKREIERRFVTRRRIDDDFERLLANLEIDDELRGQAEAVISEIRARMEEETLPALIEEGADPDLVREAFAKRFEQVRLAKMQRYLPRLLPREDRPDFEDPDWDEREDAVPHWVTAVHLLLMVWTILNAHYSQVFVLGFFFFLGFAQITSPYQNTIRLRSALLVGFFLAGLVIHGGVQAWWIAPVLGGLGELPLMTVGALLSAFNDNAAITFLSTLVPDLTDGLKRAVVAGAVTGGGLTIIANSPNPAGAALLKQHFGGNVSPVGLLTWVAGPTLLVGACFVLL
ncbi:MAG: putative Na+/H+ antiporter [Myxococcota bacterium]|nr:putative Na+/H+ antiporter [Myxococcota bacterium]